MGIINKIYRFYGPTQSGYLYSEQNPNDKMRFSYHIIVMKKGFPVVLDVGNTIKVLQQGDIRLEPLDKSGMEYELFTRLKGIADNTNIIALQNKDNRLMHNHHMEKPYKQAR